MKYVGIVTMILMTAGIAAGCDKNPKSPETKSTDSLTANDAAATPSVEPPVAVAANDGVSEGPFGLSAGMSLAQLRTKFGASSLEEPAGGFKLDRVPKPHATFEAYVAVATEQDGLCQILAIGKTTTTSVYGSELKRSFTSLQEGLVAKYGTHKTYDRLNAGSIWDDPQDWMRALEKHERILVSFWDKEEGSTLSNQISAISLEAVAEDTESGFLRLVYDFDNAESCKKSLKFKADASL